MPDEVEAAIGLAERDPAIKVIVLRGAGRAFSGGYDFGGGFKQWGESMNTEGHWDPGKDFAMTSGRATSPTQKFMAIWRASKPVIAQVHGWCVGGASDYALCADIVIASDDAVIGTPYARIWGAYLSGMWLYRLSLAKAKWHSLTGEPLTGKEAAEIELINESVPFERLEARIAEVAAMLSRIPLSQLQAQKLVVNQAYENMGLASTQTLGGILDGLMRNTPDALAVHRHRRHRRRAHRDRQAAMARGATTARPRPSGGPTRRTSSSPRAGPQVEQGIEVGDGAQRVVEMRARGGADELAADTVSQLRQRHAEIRAALPIAPGHSCHGSTRTFAVTDVIVRADASIEPSTVYSCTIVSTPSPSTCESRKWAANSSAGPRWPTRLRPPGRNWDWPGSGGCRRSDNG